MKPKNLERRQKIDAAALTGFKLSEELLGRILKVETYIEALIRVQERRTWYERLFRNVTVDDVRKEIVAIVEEMKRNGAHAQPASTDGDGPSIPHSRAGTTVNAGDSN